MWKSNDQYYHDLMDGMNMQKNFSFFFISLFSAMEEVTNMDLLEAQNASLGKYN
jgi:hypothetical protein